VSPRKKSLPIHRRLGGKSKLLSVIVTYILEFARKLSDLLAGHITFRARKDRAATKHLWEILIPKPDNKRRRFSKNHNNCFYATLEYFSGGYTPFPAVNGVWVHNGKRYRDRMVPVRFKASRTTAKRIANYAWTHYRQISIMAYLVAKAKDIILVGQQEETKSKKWPKRRRVVRGKRYGKK
jgi:hypothetical protein